MDCPVCKYPNPAGATHCGMCYEVFNRSAAQAYLQAMKRERRETEGIPEEPQAVIKSERVVEKTKAILAKVDWPALAQQARAWGKRLVLPLLGVVLLVAAWMLIHILFSASLWYHLFGKTLTYRFDGKVPAHYLVGMKQHIKCWSERQGRLDTPMQEFSTDEVGNILLEKKGTPKGSLQILANSKDWIQILNDQAGSASRAIPKNHPSLAGGRLIFTPKGVLLERRYPLSPRVGKSLPFLAPRLPPKSIKRGAVWEESVEWLDQYDNWKILWTGTLHWTLGDLEDCGGANCAKLTYTADLEPHLRGSPAWAQGIVHEASATATGEGEAFFETSKERLLSNTFSYDGLMHIPIAKLERIPWELRIGRGVRGPGEIVLRFENKIDIRKN